MSIVIWLTGLSGSGKTTIASALKEKIELIGGTALVLDGDALRATKEHQHFGFDKNSISENNLRIANLAREKKSSVDVVLIPVIAPCSSDRAKNRQIIGKEFVEVYVNCPLDECIARDTKGLYNKAIIGEIDNLIGYENGVKYEAPVHPDLELRTDKLTIYECVQKLMDFLNKNSFLVNKK